MSKHTVKRYVEIDEFEVELTISFEYDKGEPYPTFGELAEPPSIEILEILAKAPNGEQVAFEPSYSRENEFKEWLHEHPERWE